MESIPVRQVVSAAATVQQKFVASGRWNTIADIGIRRRYRHPTDRRRFGAVRSKISSFQDVQGYVKPLRLLPVEEVDVTREDSSFGAEKSQCLYRFELETSRASGSSLSDLNSRILLCLIDENGSSVLRAVSAGSSDNISAPMNTNYRENLGFQRGCIDEVTFKGPKLSSIVALWIGLESGQWRMAGVSLSVLSARSSSAEENHEDNNTYYRSKYDFNVDEIMLGEDTDLSMVELRPCLVTDLPGSQPSAILTSNTPEQPFSDIVGTSNEESMNEYRDLKFSLLLYDSILIVMGSTVASFALGETSGASFFIGGITGFLYLLLLQRSVDGLQVLESVSENEQTSSGFKTPILSVALPLGITVLAVKYGIGESPFPLTAKDLLMGMLGFLVCKLAVVIAAVKPIRSVSRES